MRYGSFPQASIILLLTLLAAGHSSGDEVIVLTCHQTWDSRIYVMDMQGNVLDWHQYEFYRLCDVEVVGEEVHVVDAFAPRSFRVDLETWELETVIDDWSLYYFYDLAFDGSYLYVTEWDLNRYLPDGTKDSSADFDHDVMGSCCQGARLWTLCDDDTVRCWNTSEWPELTEVESAAFSPPGEACRGLWHDGEHFWSAEALESSCGMIYRFDDSGTVLSQLQAPAFTGWAACTFDGYPSGLTESTWGALKGHPW